MGTKIVMFNKKIKQEVRLLSYKIEACEGKTERSYSRELEFLTEVEKLRQQINKLEKESDHQREINMRREQSLFEFIKPLVELPNQIKALKKFLSIEIVRNPADLTCVKKSKIKTKT